MIKNQTNGMVGGKSSRKIFLQRIQAGAYLKIVDQCGEGGQGNLGLVTTPVRASVWLSLKNPEAGPPCLIEEISAMGGVFEGHSSYKKSRNGEAINAGGTNYIGGIKFNSIDDAIEFLAQYFDVNWCDDCDPCEKTALRKTAATDVTQPKVEFQQTISSASGLFQKHISKNGEFSFSCFYKDLRNEFIKLGLLVEVFGHDSHLAKSWPDFPGVYVVRSKQSGQSGTETDFHTSVLYVGMTGKLSRTCTSIPGRLTSRPIRWDPYCFTKDSFNYGYDRQKKCYAQKVSAADIEVDCFIFDPHAAAAPTFLEALILQAYALSAKHVSDRLPVGNNAF